MLGNLKAPSGVGILKSLEVNSILFTGFWHSPPSSYCTSSIFVHNLPFALLRLSEHQKCSKNLRIARHLCEVYNQFFFKCMLSARGHVWRLAFSPSSSWLVNVTCKPFLKHLAQGRRSLIPGSGLQFRAWKAFLQGCVHDSYRFLTRILCACRDIYAYGFSSSVFEKLATFPAHTTV